MLGSQNAAAARSAPGANHFAASVLLALAQELLANRLAARLPYQLPVE